MKLSDAIDKFKKYKLVGGLSPDYFRHYERELLKLKSFFDGELEDFTIDNACDFLATYDNQGQKARTKTYLKMFLKYFSDLQIINFPYNLIECKKPISKPYSALSYEEFIYIDKCLENLIKSNPKPCYYKYRAMHHTLWSTGCRRHELLNIELKDINWITGEFSFLAGKGNGRRKGKFFTGMGALRGYISNCKPKKYLFECHERNVAQMMIFLHTNFDISQELSAHCYRAGLITWLTVDKKIPIKVVQEYVGHSDINTTARYARVSGREMINQIGDAFTPTKSIKTTLRLGKKEIKFGAEIKG